MGELKVAKAALPSHSPRTPLALPCWPPLKPRNVFAGKHLVLAASYLLRNSALSHQFQGMLFRVSVFTKLLWIIGILHLQSTFFSMSSLRIILSKFSGFSSEGTTAILYHSPVEISNSPYFNSFSVNCRYPASPVRSRYASSRSFSFTIHAISTCTLSPGFSVGI